MNKKVCGMLLCVEVI